MRVNMEHYEKLMTDTVRDQGAMLTKFLSNLKLIAGGIHGNGYY